MDRNRRIKLLALALRLPLALSLSLIAQRVMGLNEEFRTYNAPEALAMGGAYAADATGYVANYYNPANLGKASKKNWELTPVDLEGNAGLNAFSLDLAAHSLGIYRLVNTMSRNPGKYNYFDFTSCPGFSRRGFGLSGIANYEYAGRYDGSNLDVHAGETVGTTVGGAMNFLGNTLKLGVAGKVLLRNQLNGVFPLAQVGAGDSAIAHLMKEGIGFGADVGMTLTLPNKYLPTLGIVWTDALNTRFIATHILNPDASGAPDSIPQNLNVAASLHPHLGHHWRMTMALEIDGIQHQHVPFLQRTHVGIQLVNDHQWYLWAGINQIYPTGGVGLKMKGGTLEVGTYAENVSTNPYGMEGDRRLFFRYTIGF